MEVELEQSRQREDVRGVCDDAIEVTKAPGRVSQQAVPAAEARQVGEQESFGMIFDVVVDDTGVQPQRARIAQERECGLGLDRVAIEGGALCLCRMQRQRLNRIVEALGQQAHESAAVPVGVAQ